MTPITNTTDLTEVFVCDLLREGEIPEMCFAEVWFHDETYYVNFNFRDLLYGTDPIPDYEIEPEDRGELLASFKEWMKANGELFWTIIYNDETFIKYHNY